MTAPFDRAALDAAWDRVRRVLVVRLDNAGDVVLLSPALRTLAQGIPHATFTLLASPGGAQAARLLPWVEDVIVHRASWQQLRPGATVREDDLGLIRYLEERAFDAAIVFTSSRQTSVAPAYACYLAGVPLRAAFGDRFAGQVLTHQIPPPPEALHHAERNLRLVEALGFHATSRALELRIDADAAEEARRVLTSLNGALDGTREDGRYVLLAPGASAPARRYPAGAFQVVARGLRHATGLPVLVTGSEAERDLVQQVATPACAGVAPLAGQTSVTGVAALVQGASLVVTNNSLTMHLAEALGVPCVVTYSGTDPQGHWAPRRTPSALLARPVECAPCYAIDCPYGLECLDVPPAEVIRAASELLRGSEGGALQRPASRGRRGAA